MSMKYEPLENMPEAIEGKMVPTLNGFGYMTENLDPISLRFTTASQHINLPKFEIGAAYGNAVLKSLKEGFRIIANDLDKRHLDILWRRAVDLNLEKNLSLLPGAFPYATFLEKNSLSSVLACRVFHFFNERGFLDAIAHIYDSLCAGGQLFIVLDTPYNNYYKNMLPIFEHRVSRGVRWPGLFQGAEIVKCIDGYDLEKFPNCINLFNKECLESLLVEAGFEIEIVEYLPRPDYLSEGQMDGRECVGAVAIKPR